MTFAEKILSYQFSLSPPFPVDPVEWLMPYEGRETQRVMETFYHRFYADVNKRTFILGINPGRFGAGTTGVPFTDPIRLDKLGIVNTFPKKQELSSVFIYDMIHLCGGPELFYSKYYITSLSPLGFIKNGKNYNYYDDRKLSEKIKPYIVENLNAQADFGTDRSVVFCLGQGKNYSYLSNLNDQYNWWDRVVPLPHPRWIMQYRLKRKEEFLELYQENLIGHGS